LLFWAIGDTITAKMSARLKTGLWVQAQVRLCDLQFIPIAVTRRGDPDAGSILLKLVHKDGLCLLLRRTTTFEGEQGWAVAAGGGAAGGGSAGNGAAGTNKVSEETADGYIERESARDRDLWVVEIEDYDGRYEIDGPVER
jgi:hypothetical protein